MFGFGIGELMIVFIVAMVFLGSEKVAHVRREAHPDQSGVRHEPSSWKASDWLLIVVVAGLGLLLVSLAVSSR